MGEHKLTLEQIAAMDNIDFGAIVKAGPENDPFKHIVVGKDCLNREYLGISDGPIRGNAVRTFDERFSDLDDEDDDYYANAHFDDY